jgi:hypothetical protein
LALRIIVGHTSAVGHALLEVSLFLIARAFGASGCRVTGFARRKRLRDQRVSFPRDFDGYRIGVAGHGRKKDRCACNSSRLNPGHHRKPSGSKIVVLAQLRTTKSLRGRRDGMIYGTCANVADRADAAPGISASRNLHGGAIR